MPNFDKSIIPRFVMLYEQQLLQWAKSLERRKGLIVAIARKGPRLIEALAKFGLIDSSILKWVISERALPFISYDTPQIIVSDDHICWGSTFDKVINTIQSHPAISSNNVEVLGIPFAVSEGAKEAYIEKLSDYFIKIKTDEVPPFVSNQMNLFRLLGKPYDIEHPILTIEGDFSNIGNVLSIIDTLKDYLNGFSVDISSIVPIKAGSIKSNAWSIVYANNTANGDATDGLNKLRIYLDSNNRAIRIAAIRQIAIANPLDLITPQTLFNEPNF